MNMCLCIDAGKLIVGCSVQASMGPPVTESAQTLASSGKPTPAPRPGPNKGSSGAAAAAKHASSPHHAPGPTSPHAPAHAPAPAPALAHAPTEPSRHEPKEAGHSHAPAPAPASSRPKQERAPAPAPEKPVHAPVPAPAPMPAHERATPAPAPAEQQHSHKPDAAGPAKPEAPSTPVGPRSPEAPAAAPKHPAAVSPSPKPRAETAKAISATVPAPVSCTKTFSDALELCQGGYTECLDIAEEDCVTDPMSSAGTHATGFTARCVQGKQSVSLLHGAFLLCCLLLRMQLLEGRGPKASPCGLQAFLPILCAGHDLLQQRHRCGPSASNGQMQLPGACTVFAYWCRHRKKCSPLSACLTPCLCSELSIRSQQRGERLIMCLSQLDQSWTKL